MCANPPKLNFLTLHKCGLSTANLVPFCAALPHNTHLEPLQFTGHDLSAAFINRHLMPSACATIEAWTVWTYCWMTTTSHAS